MALFPMNAAKTPQNEFLACLGAEGWGFFSINGGATVYAANANTYSNSGTNISVNSRVITFLSSGRYIYDFKDTSGGSNVHYDNYYSQGNTISISGYGLCSVIKVD